VLRTRHGAPQPLTPSAAYDCPTELCPGTSNRKSAPMSDSVAAAIWTQALLSLSPAR